YKWILHATVATGGGTGTTTRTFELVESTVGASDLPVDTLVPGLLAGAPDARAYKDVGLPFTRERLLTVVDPRELVPQEAGTYTHLLQLWVSDRPFTPGVANIVPQAVDGEIDQPADSVSWLIEVLDTPECATATLVEDAP
ncbi:MAG: hypothetical protein ACO3JL_21490, partial [Myxococcota bacterium]